MKNDWHRLLLWQLRYRIQRIFGLDCEWVLVKRGDGFYNARCRWCGLYKARGRYS